jgi:hypothetical protein
MLVENVMADPERRVWTLAERYAGPLGEAGDGWQVYRARGRALRYMTVRPAHGI